MSQTCLYYNSLEDITLSFYCPMTSRSRSDIPKNPLCAGLYWVHFKNNIIFGVEDVRVGYPAERSHHITVKDSVHVNICLEVYRQTLVHSLDGQK